MAFDCIERRVSDFFYYYGHLVHLRAVTFIAVPILVSLLIAIRFTIPIPPLSESGDFYAPSRYGPFVDSLELLEKYFPLNETGDRSYALRRVDQRRMGRLLIKAKQRCISIVDRVDLDAMVEVLGLWKAIFDISIYLHHRTDDYSTLCVKSPQRSISALREAISASDFADIPANQTAPPISVPLTNECVMSPLPALTYHMVYQVYNLSYPINYVQYLGYLYIGDLVGAAKYTHKFIQPATPINTPLILPNSTGAPLFDDNTTITIPIGTDAPDTTTVFNLTDASSTTGAPLDACVARKQGENVTEGYGYSKSVSVISHADVIALPYMLLHQSEIIDDISRQWELKLSDFLSGVNSTLFDIAWWTSETLSEQIETYVNEPIQSYLLAMIIIVTFLAVVYSSSLDENCSPWSVRAKYMEAFGAIITILLSLLTGYFLVLMTGQPLATFAKMTPFIIIPLGLSYYVFLLASWRQTDAAAHVGERIAKVLKDVGVPLLMIAIIDACSFGFGIYSQYPAVNVFCSYATMSIVLLPAYVFTMLIGILMLGGRREAKFRQSLCCCDMPASLVYDDAPSANPTALEHQAPSYAQATSKFKRIEDFAFTTWQPDRRQVSIDRYPPRRRLLPSTSSFFGGAFTSFIKAWWGKLIILLLFALYLAGAIVGSMKLAEGGLPHSQLAFVLPQPSYGQRYIQWQDRYFSNYTDSAHLFYDGLDKYPLTFKFLNELDKDVARFEQQCAEFALQSDANRGNWLRKFMKFARPEASSSNSSDEAAVVARLVRKFFANETLSAYYQSDLVFTADAKHLSVSRFTLTLRNAGEANKTQIMRVMRDAAAASAYQAHVYHPSFAFASERDVVVRNLLQTILPAGGVILLVCFVFIPHPCVALMTALSTASVVFGVIGYMALWHVKLYFASLAVIFLAVGFSSHFPIIFAHQLVKGMSIFGKMNESVRYALRSVAVPVIQSALAMIVSGLLTFGIAWQPAITFAKIVILTNAFSVFHSLLVLPVLIDLVMAPKQCMLRTSAVTDNGRQLPHES